MATDAELQELAEAATPGGASAAGAVDPPPLARQVPPGTPGAVEGPVFKDPAAPPLVDPVIAAGTPGLADSSAVVPPPPVVPPAAPVPVVPAAPDAAAPNFVAPALRTGKPTMAAASQALDQATQAGFDQAKAQEAVGAAKGEERQADAKVADVAAAQQRQNAAEMDTKIRAQEEGRARAQAIADKADEDYRNFQIHDFLKERSTAEVIKSKIFTAFGAFGQGLVGGDNPALENIKMALDHDFKIQAQQLGQREKFAERKRAGATSLSEEYKSDLAALQLKQAAATDAVAAEAKAQLIRNGATVADAENNAMVKNLKKQALDLRASGQEKLWQAQASLAMSGAHLALARETAEGNREAKKAAADDKKENTEVRAGKDDPSGKPAGAPLGHVPSGKGGAQAFATRDSDYARALQQLDVYHKDILENGERPITPAAIKRRETLKHNADIAVATVSPLGKTDEAMKAESGSIGSGGTGIGGFIMGANPEAVASKISELKEQRQRYREETLIPMKGGAGPTPGGAPAGRRVLYKGAPGTLVGTDFIPD